MESEWDVAEPWKCGPLYLGMHRDELVQHVGFEGEVSPRYPSSELFESDSMEVNAAWSESNVLTYLCVATPTPVTVLGKPVFGVRQQDVIDELLQVTPVVPDGGFDVGIYLPRLDCILGDWVDQGPDLDRQDMPIYQITFDYNGVGKLRLGIDGA